MVTATFGVRCVCYVKWYRCKPDAENTNIYCYQQRCKDLPVSDEILEDC